MLDEFGNLKFKNLLLQIFSSWSQWPPLLFTWLFRFFWILTKRKAIRRALLSLMAVPLLQMDNAQDLLSFGGLQVVINGLNSTEPLVKEYAAFVLGAAFSRWAAWMDIPLARIVGALQVKSSFTFGLIGLEEGYTWTLAHPYTHFIVILVKLG